MRLHASVFIGLAVGLALGGWLGRSSAPSVPAVAFVGAGEPSRESALASGREALEAGLRSALVESGLARLELAARVDDLERLPADGGGPDYSRIVSEGISTLSDRELESMLASTVHLSLEEIGEVRDIRTFSKRLAEIAMQDIIEPETSPDGVDHVVFTTSPAMGNVDARTHFGTDANRIYAVFPTDRFGKDSVMVKWYRRDRPVILLFERYSIVPGDPSGYVWLSRRWEPGQYKVSIYSGDETMNPLASGNYWVQ